MKGLLSHFVLTMLFVFSLLLIAKQAFAQDDSSSEIIIEENPPDAVTDTNVDSSDDVVLETASEPVQDENSEVVVERSDEQNLEAKSDKNSDENDGTIEIIYPAEYTAPYRDRRSEWGLTFSLGRAEFYPDKFRSRIDSLSYDQLYDSTPLIIYEGELGLKYNTTLGSLGVGLSIASGAVDGVAKINGQKTGGPRDMKLTKAGINGTYTLDTLFKDPYVAPYVSAEVFQIDWEENDRVNKFSESGTTAFAIGIKAGVLITINWLEPDVALHSQSETGLQNTFLDLYISQYNTSESETDPNFETPMNFGGGIKLEF